MKISKSLIGLNLHQQLKGENLPEGLFLHCALVAAVRVPQTSVVAIRVPQTPVAAVRVPQTPVVAVWVPQTPLAPE